MFHHLVVVLQGGIALELLHHEDITLSERVVQTPPVRVEVDPARVGVVMVHLHHPGEDAVVVLSQELGHDELVDP